MEPRFIIVSAYITPMLKFHLQDMKIEQIVEKPLHIDQL